MTTDTTERGLERLICTAPIGAPCETRTAPADAVRENTAPCGGSGWISGQPEDYDGEYYVDLVQLACLRAIQPRTHTR